MTEKINLVEQLKTYFGFGKFKGNQEAIIRNDAYGRWQVSLLSIAIFVDGWNGNCDFSSYCFDEESG